MLEKFYNNKRQILKKSLEFFLNSNSQIPKIGCELEFFLLEKNSQTPANPEFVDDFIFELGKFYQTQKERGISQIEIKTNFTADLIALCEELENCKKHITQLAENKNLTASFEAQPFLDDCGSALQFNLSLHADDGRNLFLSDENLLKNSAASLLSLSDAMMIFLAPKAEDYQRFSSELNRQLFKNGKFPAPINLSFGADNRTCAIRIPNITKEKPNKRLEYRIASISADPWLCISSILFALTQKSQTNFEQIFGNAFDGQYQLKNFSQNLEESEKKFWQEENLIRKKFEEFNE